MKDGVALVFNDIAATKTALFLALSEALLRPPLLNTQDLLYMHDTIEVFSENLDELQELFRGAIAPKLHPRRLAELEGAADRLFGKVEDTIREAARMPAGRKLTAERLAETAQAGLKEVFGKKAA